MRGGDSDYNVVLIDGVRANLDGGRFDFRRVAAAEIERVEVLRGAQSALWGADAMTSVVQIITKRANPTSAPEVSGSVEGGSFSTFRGNAGVYGGTGTKVDIAQPLRVAKQMARSPTSCRRTIDIRRRHSMAAWVSRLARRHRREADYGKATAMAKSSVR